ncbi:MAG TPA: glycosyl hydrolase family 28-related protein, partial [Vicinamibacteria bacterium]
MQTCRIVGAGALLWFLGPDSLSAPPPPAGMVVSVKDYGAKGDGTTPDTDAIQRAVNAVRSGGTVL